MTHARCCKCGQSAGPFADVCCNGVCGYRTDPTMSLQTTGTIELERLGFTGSVTNPPWLSTVPQCSHQSQRVQADVVNANNSAIAALEAQAFASLTQTLDPPAPLPGNDYYAYFEILARGAPTSSTWRLNIGIGIRSDGSVEVAATERFGNDFSTLAPISTAGLSGSAVIGTSGCIVGMSCDLDAFSARGLTVDGSMPAELLNVFPCQSVSP